MYLYDYVGVPREILGRSKSQATLIYRASGIRLDWRNCPTTAEELLENRACRERPGAMRLVLRLIDFEAALPLKLSSETFGVSWIPDDGSFAYMATVCADRAHRLARAKPGLEGVLLGHVIAHELGHLLLGTNSHSKAGLMHIPWGKNEIQLAERGRLHFSLQESRSLRENVRNRSRQQ